MSKPCKYCDKPIEWGYAGDRWIALVPLGQDEGLDREFQDEKGNLRASHRQLCVFTGSESLRISRLAKIVEAKDLPPPKVDNDTGEILPYTIKDTLAAPP
jgi:hypothetical protein